MSRMQDPYCYPGTDVLTNQVELRDRAQLDAFEAKVVALNLVELTQKPITGPVDATRLKETHRRIFEHVYPWAGQYRVNTGVMSKQRPQGYLVTYADSAFVARELEKVFRSLAAEQPLRGRPLEHVAARAAHWYGEIDARHAFREGNSRTGRKFIADFVREAGFNLEWSKISETPGGRERLMLARDYAVINADSIELAEIFVEAMSPITREQENQRDQGLPSATPPRPAAAGGSYVGAIESVTRGEVLQDTNGERIRHQLAMFMSGSGGFGLLKTGAVVRIDYSGALWKVRDPNQKTRSQRR